MTVNYKLVAVEVFKNFALDSLCTYHRKFSDLMESGVGNGRLFKCIHVAVHYLIITKIN
jgi:hypothetical protein